MTDDIQFPAQQQTPPGLTGEMRPEPDHGERTYIGHAGVRPPGPRPRTRRTSPARCSA